MPEDIDDIMAKYSKISRDKKEKQQSESDAELRLRCMELGVSYASSALGMGDPVTFAKEFYNFILNKEQ